MKNFSMILSLIIASSSFAADGKCKVGIDTDGLNDAQTAVVQSMAKQLEALGCTVGAPESHVTSAPSSSADLNSASACTSEQVPTVQYGCVASSGSCTIPGTNAQGIIYNNQCIASGYSANAAYTGYNPAVSCTTGQFPVLVGSQVTCLSQGSCYAGQAMYNGQCYTLNPYGYGGYRGNGFAFHIGY